VKTDQDRGVGERESGEREKGERGGGGRDFFANYKSRYLYSLSEIM
jgi:hypothetical protein